MRYYRPQRKHVSISVSQDFRDLLTLHAKKKGFTTPSAYIKHLVMLELKEEIDAAVANDKEIS